MNASATKHTAGPWTYQDRGGREGWLVVDPQSDNGDIIAQVDPDNIMEDLGYSNEANARLIAAAPELLSALVDLLDACPASCEDRRLMDAQRAAERVIRKVNGEQ